ncbi:hypothetical protein [Evansella tamaricis]|uniref:Uncharacterized protein n=1 Tax=Evansella tamaricis TaxID=2069301 RepID=A0ABS6JLH4_9BACI|nr:hypothetical protein [Evansella tamaricis]MBU9714526.1 hypothetical protein [Evansella tamaricis]
MSGLKSVELQVALPRTQTAGKIQDQLQQRGQVSQNQMTQTETEKLERQRKQVNESEKIGKKRLNNDGEEHEHKGKENPHQKRKSSKKAEDLEGKHPYKGNHVDVKW